MCRIVHGILGSDGSNAKRSPATRSLRPPLYNFEDCGPDAARLLARILHRLDIGRWHTCDKILNIILNIRYTLYYFNKVGTSDVFSPNNFCGELFESIYLIKSDAYPSTPYSRYNRSRNGPSK